MDVEETTVQASAMINYLYQALSEANGRIANLVGEKAVIELKLRKVQESPALPPDHDPPSGPMQEATVA